MSLEADLESDRKRQQIHADAARSKFQNLEMVKLIKNPGFTVASFQEQADKLIAQAEQVKAKHAQAVADAEARAATAGETEVEPVVLSKDDEAVIKDGANAELILASIERIGA